MSKEQKGVPFEDHSTTGDQRRLCSHMEVSWEVLVSPWLLWLQEKPILLSEACGTPWLHKATMWRW